MRAVAFGGACAALACLITLDARAEGEKPRVVARAEAARARPALFSAGAAPRDLPTGARDRDKLTTARISATSPRIDVAAGLEIGLRDFRYNDRLTTNLRSYSVVGAPLAGGEIDLAPFASQSGPLLSRLGVTGGYAASVGLSSRVDGTELATSWSRFFVGPCFRVRFEGAPTVDLGGSVTYAGESIDFSGAAAALAAQLPAVAYRDVRAGVDVRVSTGRVGGFLKAGYSYVLSAGDVADRSPGASVAGLDATLGGSVAIGLGFEVRLGGSYRRFFYSFYPSPGDTYIAGGAVDQLASLELALAWAR